MPRVGHSRCTEEHREATTRGGSRTEKRWSSAGQTLAARACPPSSGSADAIPTPGRAGRPGHRSGGDTPARRVLPAGRGDGPLRSAGSGTGGPRRACGARAIPVARLDPGRVPRARGALRGGHRRPPPRSCPWPVAHSVHPGSPRPWSRPSAIGTATRRRADDSLANAPRVARPRNGPLSPVGGREGGALPQQHERHDEHQHHDREQPELQHGVEKDVVPRWARCANSAVTTRIRRVAAISPTMRKGSGTNVCSRKETCTV